MTAWVEDERGESKNIVKHEEEAEEAKSVFAKWWPIFSIHIHPDTHINTHTHTHSMVTHLSVGGEVQTFNL